MPYTNDELYDLYRELPLDVRQAFGTIEYMEVIDDIEKKHRLHLDQVAKLSNEIYKLMLGVTRPQAFIGSIESAVNVPNETAKEIAVEVNEKIFRPVRESLMRIHKMAEAHNMETKNFTEEKLTEPFSLPKKTAAPDPYRESVA